MKLSLCSDYMWVYEENPQESADITIELEKIWDLARKLNPISECKISILSLHGSHKQEIKLIFN